MFPYVILICGIVLCCFVLVTYFSSNKKRLSSKDFQEQKKRMRPHCSEADYLAFMEFLFKYPGGYRRRNRDGSIYCDYLGKEKGDLKGIFFNIIIPNPNLHTYQKEEFRQFARSIGVTGIDQRPDYETRDSVLKNRETDLDQFARKEVGNIGEQIVRDHLKELETYQYAVINGAKLSLNGEVREYDHIVVGRGGVFVVETKAFGMTNGRPKKAALFIDPGDKWILRKNNINHDLTSPTEQIKAEAEHLSAVIGTYMFPVHSIVALSNQELFIKQNISLPYQGVRADHLIETIRSNNDRLNDSDVAAIVHSIDESRIN